MCIAYHIDGLDNLEVGCENDDQWEDEAEEVDVGNICYLKYKQIASIDKQIFENDSPSL